MTVGCDIPVCHGATTVAPDRQVIWMSPRCWMVLCPTDLEWELIEAAEVAFPNRLVHATPFSDYFAWFALGGPGAAAALRQGTFISFAADGLAIGAAKRTPIAGIPAVLIRDSDDAWRNGVERSRAQFFLSWLQHLTSSPKSSTIQNWKIRPFHVP